MPSITTVADLFYIIGASGAGKDSLIRYARQRIQSDTPVVFAHRYITRLRDAGGENHIALSVEEFHSRSRQGCFAMQWYSHQTWYGIGIEINQWLSEGLTVVVNGSRDYLHDAVDRYPELIPVLITADRETLRARLVARGRESAEQIESRLAQADELNGRVQHPRLVQIHNNCDLVEAGDRLVRLLMGDCGQCD